MEKAWGYETGLYNICIDFNRAYDTTDRVVVDEEVIDMRIFLNLENACR